MITAKLSKKYSDIITDDEWTYIHQYLVNLRPFTIYSTQHVKDKGSSDCIFVDTTSPLPLSGIPYDWTGKISRNFRNCDSCGYGIFKTYFADDNSVICSECDKITDKWIIVNPVWRVEI